MMTPIANRIENAIQIPLMSLILFKLLSDRFYPFCYCGTNVPTPLLMGLEGVVGRGGNTGEGAKAGPAGFGVGEGTGGLVTAIGGGCGTAPGAVGAGVGAGPMVVTAAGFASVLT